MRDFMVLRDGCEWMYSMKCDIRTAMRFVRIATRFAKTKITLAEIIDKPTIGIIKIGEWYNGKRIRSKTDKSVIG